MQVNVLADILFEISANSSTLLIICHYVTPFFDKKNPPNISINAATVVIGGATFGRSFLLPLGSGNANHSPIGSN